MMVRELGFEMKAQPSEKMKSPEELAKDEKEKLQKLEVSVQKCPFFTRFDSSPDINPAHLLQADRLRRMMGEEAEDSTKTQTHFSADDLNDGFILDKHDRKTLSYQVEDRTNKDHLNVNAESAFTVTLSFLFGFLYFFAVRLLLLNL